jgi:two-component system cell cycle sensor histidine kinase/response regulator CckA
MTKAVTAIHFRARLHYGSPVFGYVVALTLIVLAGMGRLVLMNNGDSRGPFLLFYPAIAAAAFVGGAGPGVFSITAGALFAASIFPWFPERASWILFAILGPLLAAGFVYFREIREQRAAVAEECARFRFITEHIHDWIFLTGGSGVIQFANQTACNHFCPDKGTLMGRAIEDLSPEWQRPAVRALLRQCRSGPAAPSEIAFKRPDGSEVQAEVSGTAVRTGADVVIHFVARDITDRKRLDQTLREAEQWESLRVLAGGLAHEFNNLLQSIVGNATLARQELSLGHSASPLLENVEQACNRSAHLVRMMLATSGYRQRYSQPVRMDQMLRKILADRETPERIRVSMDVPALEFNGDRTSLETLLGSLVANAVESYGETSGDIRISIGQSTAQGSEKGSFEEGEPGRGECLRIVVEDQGGGMTQEVLDRAFEPFFTTKFVGRGLGLPAVRGIVRAYSGKLWLKTSAGEGTRVEIWLPLQGTL